MSTAREREIEACLETPAWHQVAPCLATAPEQDDFPGGDVSRQPLPAGARIGPYKIIRFIAAGGMGEVYAGLDTRLDRLVAIKRLTATSAADDERLRLFEQEARAAAALTHANVLAVHDIGTHDGCPYLVSECLEGETLRARLDRGPFPTRDAIDFALHLAGALAAVHAHGIVHGDVTPQNVFLTRDGTLKLLDFGLARLLQPLSPAGADAGYRGNTTGRVAGTPGYIAPERLSGGAFTPRGDIFSFGCVVYEMLTGAGGEWPRNGMLSRELRELVDRCLHHLPESRPSLEEIVRVLRALRAPAHPFRPLALWLPFTAVIAALTALTPVALGRSAAPGGDRWRRSPAYEEYVRGFALSHSLRGSLEVLEAARNHYEAALRREPAYPLALVGLADIEIVQFVRGFDASPERVARAEELVRQALASAPDLAEAHYALGSVLGWGRRDFNAAVRAFEAGIRLEPSGRGWLGLAWALASLEPPRAAEAEHAARQGLRLAPDDPYAYLQLARALRQQRRYQEAVLALEDVLRFDPLFGAGYTLLARIHLDRNDPRRALAVLEAMPAAIDPEHPGSAERAVGAHARQVYKSAAHASLGETDLALAEVEAALKNGYRDWQFLDGGAFDRLRSDRRFQNLLATYR